MASQQIPSHLIGLDIPKGEPITLNRRGFIAIDRRVDATYEATYRPQALYNRANNGFNENNEAFLLHEASTNLPIYREDTGPTDFHLHLPPGGFQLVLVTSGCFAFDYDGRMSQAAPGTVMLQSAIVHRQLFYTWSGMETKKNLETPQSVVPDALTMGYSGKFLEAFITDPTTFPNPTIVSKNIIDEAETSKIAWSHLSHDRPAGASFWYQDPYSLNALYRKISETKIISKRGVYIRDLGIQHASGELVCGHIIATDPDGYSLLPKSHKAILSDCDFAKGEVVIFRIIRGAATISDNFGRMITMQAGDTITANPQSITLHEMQADTQILRLGLLDGIEKLRSWTPVQRDEIDKLGHRLIVQHETRNIDKIERPIGYLF